MTDSALMLPAGITASETGLQFPPRVPWETWLTVGETLSRVSAGLRWAVGDWLIYGEAEYGERYAQGMELTGWDYQRLANAVWVARQYPPEQRRQDLPWSHHEAAATLTAGPRAALLATAALEGWSRAQVRAAVAEKDDSSVSRGPAAVRAIRRERVGLQAEVAKLLEPHVDGADVAVLLAEQCLDIVEQGLGR